MFSTDPFQRLTVGGTFNRTFKIFIQRYDLFMIIAGIAFVPLAFMMITYFEILGASLYTVTDVINSQQNISASSGFDEFGNDCSSSTSGDCNVENVYVANMSSFTSQILIEYACFVVLIIAAKAAMTHAVAELYMGRDPKWLDCVKEGFSRWCDIFGTGALISFGIFIMNIATEIIAFLLMMTASKVMIVVSIFMWIIWLILLFYLSVSFMILTPVIMVERMGPIHTIKRCWQLSRNNRCYTFCTIFCFCITYYMLQLLLCIIVVNLGGLDAIASIWGAFLVSLPAIIYIPVTAIAETVAYLNIRVQQEGLNEAVLASELRLVASSGKGGVHYAPVKQAQQELV